ncbi:MAG: TonB-dependent receptor plug domain-containing protein, partial [Bacteroidota bacterium]
MHVLLTIPKRWWAILLSTLLMQAAFGQTDISGKITDAQEGSPLPGARVVVVGASIGTYTDAEGSFFLTVPSEGAVLAISYLGYAEVEEAVAGRTVINVSLETDYNSLEEVVVTGYGSKKKLDVIGAISSVSSEDFEAQPITRVSDALQGRAAGVQVNSTDGSPGNNARIRIRGTNSITGSGAPLIVVDGVIGAGLGSLNPSDIESMQVLKDASATAQYGSRGANGVILITTKRGASVQPTVSFDAFWGLQSLPRKVPVVNGGTYARLINEQVAVGGGAPIFGDDALAVLDSSGGTDWQDEIYRGGTNALQQNYSVSFSGRKEGLSYYVSGNYVDHEGILINNF